MSNKSHCKTLGAKITSSLPNIYFIVSFTSKDPKIAGVIPNTCGFLVLKLSKYSLDSSKSFSKDFYLKSSS